MNCTAVVLSAEPRPEPVLPTGCKYLNFVSKFSDCAGITNARAEAVKLVDTPWMFFLDDDDQLPVGIDKILDEAYHSGVPLVYTDEYVIDTRRGSYVRKAEPYSEIGFIDNPFMVHHLAVCDTAAIRKAAQVIPRGMYSFETAAYFVVAKQGALYIPKVGYIWHRSVNGMSHDPSCIIGVVQSAAWANRHRSYG